MNSSAAKHLRDGGRDPGDSLHVPSDARSLVLFALGSGSSRLSLRNTAVAGALNKTRIGTFLFELLTGRKKGIAPTYSILNCWRSGDASRNRTCCSMGNG